MAKRLTDSDLLIDYLNGRLGDPMRIVRDAREGRLVTSMVSRFEVLAGARSDDQFVRMARFLRSFVQIPGRRRGRCGCAHRLRASRRRDSFAERRHPDRGNCRFAWAPVDHSQPKTL